MQSFTMGTSEMVSAMFERLPDRYPLELNRDDMVALITALATSVGFVTWDDGEVPDPIRERAESLFSGIAETLGVEGI